MLRYNVLQGGFDSQFTSVLCSIYNSKIGLRTAGLWLVAPNWHFQRASLHPWRIQWYHMGLPSAAPFMVLHSVQCGTKKNCLAVDHLRPGSAEDNWRDRRAVEAESRKRSRSAGRLSAQKRSKKLAKTEA